MTFPIIIPIILIIILAIYLKLHACLSHSNSVIRHRFGNYLMISSAYFAHLAWIFIQPRLKICSLYAQFESGTKQLLILPCVFIMLKRLRHKAQTCKMRPDCRKVLASCQVFSQ